MSKLDEFIQAIPNDDVLLEFCDANFGPGGKISKEFAADKGDAMFDAFLEDLSKVDDDNPHKSTIEKRAKNRRYHDYEGDLMKLGLVNDLKAAGLDEMSKRAMMGDYDF